jgi:hypothetical protein
VLAQPDTISKFKVEKYVAPESVSIINLIATPEKYYDKRIKITGYMITEFEGTAIYLTREDYDNRIYKNSVFLLIGKGSDYQFYNKEYVTLNGTFIKGNGHMGLFSGMLEDISNIRKRN